MHMDTAVRYPSYRTSNRPTNISNRASSRARSSNYTPQSLTQPQARRSEPLRLSDEQKASLREHQAAMAKTQASLGILPSDSLTHLSAKQAGLQTTAFDSELGEIME